MTPPLNKKFEGKLQLNVTLYAVVFVLPSPTRFLIYPSREKFCSFKSSVVPPVVIFSNKYGPPVVETIVAVTFSCVVFDLPSNSLIVIIADSSFTSLRNVALTSIVWFIFAAKV